MPTWPAAGESTVSTSAAEVKDRTREAQDHVGNGKAAVAHPTSVGRLHKGVQNVESRDDDAIAEREFMALGEFLDRLNQPR